MGHTVGGPDLGMLGCDRAEVLATGMEQGSPEGSGSMAGLDWWGREERFHRRHNGAEVPCGERVAPVKVAVTRKQSRRRRVPEAGRQCTLPQPERGPQSCGDLNVLGSVATLKFWWHWWTPLPKY